MGEQRETANGQSYPRDRSDFGTAQLGGFVELEAEGAWRWAGWRLEERVGGHTSAKSEALDELDQFFTDVSESRIDAVVQVRLDVPGSHTLTTATIAVPVGMGASLPETVGRALLAAGLADETEWSIDT